MKQSLRFTLILTLFWTVLGSGTRVSAQTRPTTGATTRETVRVETPNGYVRIEAGAKMLICLPEDQDWVRAGAARVKADAGPTTQPADLLARLSQQRDRLLAAMLKDLPTLTPSQIDQLLDQTIAPNLKKLSKIQPAIVYLVSPPEYLKQAMRDGWSDRRIRYNSISDTFDVDHTISLTRDGPADESAVVVLYRPGETAEQRSNALAAHIADTQARVRQSITGRAVTLTLTQVADFIAKEALGDLPRQEDQAWLVTGLSNVLAARYVSIIHGSPVTQFIEAMVTSAQATPVAAAQLDLLRPMPLTALRDEFVPAHLDARRRKSVMVMYLWLQQAGDARLTPTLEAVQRLRPADGQTLVRVIHDASGVDLTTQLQAR